MPRESSSSAAHSDLANLRLETLRVTVDASVFLNAFLQTESGWKTSHRLLQRLQEAEVPLLEPALVLPEIAGSIARNCPGWEDLGVGFTQSLAQLPHLILIPIDASWALASARAAASNRLRGADATYAAVARRFDSVLISLDRQQLERTAELLTTTRPGPLLQTLFGESMDDQPIDSGGLYPVD